MVIDQTQKHYRYKSFQSHDLGMRIRTHRLDERVVLKFSVKGETVMMTESIAESVSGTENDNIIVFHSRAEGPVLVEQAFPKKSRLYLGTKRIFDVVASCVGLVLLSPIMLITAVMIKCEDGGPVFFVQERIGRDEKKFRMYKFRSMKMDAAEIHAKMKEEFGETEVSFKLKDDPRITKIGKSLRRTSIDELPQLLNIIKGDMGIVGNCYIIGTTKKNHVFSSVCPIG